MTIRQARAEVAGHCAATRLTLGFPHRTHTALRYQWFVTTSVPSTVLPITPLIRYLFNKDNVLQNYYERSKSPPPPPKKNNVVDAQGTNIVAGGREGKQKQPECSNILQNVVFFEEPAKKRSPCGNCKFIFEEISAWS